MDVAELNLSHVSQAMELWVRCDLTRPWNPPEVDFDRAVRSTSSTVFGALDSGELLATVMVGDDGHRGWIYYLAVDPAQRRQGLARTLLGAAEGWLAERGVRKVQVMLRGSGDQISPSTRRLGTDPRM